MACYSFSDIDGPRAFDLLARKLESIPGLQVTILLNIQRKLGDTSTPDSVVRRFADRFWGSDWPGSVQPAVYYDPRAITQDGPTGVLHAKALIADEEAVFITSANLTEAALDRNIEIGLMVRDRALAISVVTHFQRLIDRSLLAPLPKA